MLTEINNIIFRQIVNEIFSYKFDIIKTNIFKLPDESHAKELEGHQLASFERGPGYRASALELGFGFFNIISEATEGLFITELLKLQ